MVMRRIARLAATGFLLATVCQGQNKQWDRRFGGSGNDYLLSVQQTTDGGYVLGGYSESGIGGDRTESLRGVYDYWVVKVDASGNKQWDRRFGGEAMDALTAIRQTADGGYILGGHSWSGVNGDKTEATQGLSDFWVVKITANGTKQWDRRFGGSARDEISAVYQNSHGDYFLAGFSNSGANGDKTETSRGQDDYWIVKIDGNGQKLWDRRFGGSESDVLLSLWLTSDGGCIAGGYSYSGANGDKTQASRGDSDYWVVKISSTGNKQWDRRFGGSASDILTSLQQTSDGGYILGGLSLSGQGGDKTEGTRGEEDFWVLKLDSQGNKLWDRRFGGSAEDSLYVVRQTTDGGYILGGRSSSGADGDKSQASRGGFDYWIVKLDAQGLKRWDRRFGGGNWDVLRSLEQTADGGFILGGTTWSDAGGDISQASRGSGDYWIVKLRPEPAPTVQRWDPLQPIAGYTANRWAFLTAWNLSTGGFEASGNWRNGAHQWDHDATGYQEWIARFVYDQASMQTRALAWYYRQIHVQ